MLSMDSATPQAPVNRGATTHSCQSCALRKVRCDKQEPRCGACVKRGVECEYRVLPPPRRKRGVVRDRLASGCRPGYLQRPLRRKGVDVGASPKAYDLHVSSLRTNGSSMITQDTSHLQIPDSLSARTPRGAPQIQLLHNQNRSKYIDNSVWRRVIEEIRGSQCEQSAETVDALGRCSDEETEGDETAEDGIDFVLGITTASSGAEGVHPPGGQMLELWQIFLENVDPLTKIVHGPSLQPAIEEAMLDSSSIPKSLEVLLYAIYSAAVVSLKSYQCERRFGESRKTLLSRYRSATKAALSRAKFLGSANLAVLQALLIHLLSMREVYDSRTMWTLTGAALRMAEGMGLHRDGSSMGLSPFETEIRRRIWWQLKMLDGDSAELNGADKFRAFDTYPEGPGLPSNINDDDLYPGMSSSPATTDGVTDMVCCALRFELRSYWKTKTAKQRQQGIRNCVSSGYWSNATLNERDKAIDEFEAILETKYLRYCDPSQPIQLMATLIARAAVSTMRLIAHHPRKWNREEPVPQSERDYVWYASIRGLKQYNMIHSSRELERFSWHAAYYVRWHAFIHILTTLRADPLMRGAVQAWQLIDEVYETNPDFVGNTKKALHVAIGHLCVRAFSAREAALEKEGKMMPPTPSYIKTLRMREKVVDADRKGREKAVEDAEMLFNQNLTESLPEVNLPHPKPTWPSPQEALQQPGHFNNRSAPYPSDQSDGRPGGLFTTPDNANLGLDVMFTLDASMEDPFNQTVDWVKWDALIGDLT